MSLIRTILTKLYQGGLRAASQSGSSTHVCSLRQCRTITSLCQPWTPRPSGNLSPPSGLLQAPLVNSQCQARTYKMKAVLKRRCSGCYFEKRFGRMYIECTLKPRHKQMQMQKGTAIYRDDYSKGPWKRSIHWQWRQREGFYKRGDNEFARVDWLKDRIGTEV